MLSVGDAIEIVAEVDETIRATHQSIDALNQSVLDRQRAEQALREHEKTTRAQIAALEGALKAATTRASDVQQDNVRLRKRLNWIGEALAADPPAIPAAMAFVEVATPLENEAIGDHDDVYAMRARMTELESIVEQVRREAQAAIDSRRRVNWQHVGPVPAMPISVAQTLLRIVGQTEQQPSDAGALPPAGVDSFDLATAESIAARSGWSVERGALRSTIAEVGRLRANLAAVHGWLGDRLSVDRMVACIFDRLRAGDTIDQLEMEYRRDLGDPARATATKPAEPTLIDFSGCSPEEVDRRLDTLARHGLGGMPSTTFAQEAREELPPILRPMTDEQRANFKPLTEDQIREAFAQGRADARGDAWKFFHSLGPTPKGMLAANEPIQSRTVADRMRLYEQVNAQLQKLGIEIAQTKCTCGHPHDSHLGGGLCAHGVGDDGICACDQFLDANVGDAGPVTPKEEKDG